MKNILLFTLLLTFGFGQAQIRQTAYIELEIDKKIGSNYLLIDADSLGVLCVLESQKAEPGNRRQLIFALFDTELEKTWEQAYLINNSAKILNHYYDMGFVYILVQEKDFDYSIMKLNLADGIISQIAFTDLENFFITHFKASNGTLLLGGMIKDLPAVILKRYSEENKPIVLPSINQLKANLIDIVIDNENERLMVLMKKKRSGDVESFYANWYDMEGNILLNREVPLTNDYNLLTYRPYLKEDGKLLLFGSYGLKNESLAQGIYSLELDNGKLGENRFYDFGYLKNFFNYLPEKRRAKYIQKVKKRLDEGKRKRFGYKLFVHDLEIIDDKIIFMAESYDAQSDFNRQQLNQGDRYYGSTFDPSLRRYVRGLGYYSYLPTAFAVDPWWDNKPFPTEFDYVHAIALGFDKDGKLLWDNSYTFDDTESEFPIELSKVHVQNDSIAFFQYDSEEYFFKVSEKSEFTEKNALAETPTLFNEDVVDNFDHGGILKWYKNNFLVSGIKRLRNKLDSEKNRHVFFVSKFTYNSAWKDEKEEEKDNEN